MQSSPRSPLLPFVSSTEFIESIWNSPFRGSSAENGTSNLISRSCQIWFASVMAAAVAPVSCSKRCPQASRWRGLSGWRCRPSPHRDERIGEATLCSAISAKAGLLLSLDEEIVYITRVM